MSGRAAKRGVRVAVIVAGEADNFPDRVVRRASQGQYGEALGGGIKIHEHRGALLHAKTLTIDSGWASIGSINVDNRSFALNHELNLVVNGPAPARHLEQIFQDDLRFSREITLEAWKRRGIGHILELFVLPFRNLL